MEMQMEYSLEKNVCISSCSMFASNSVECSKLGKTRIIEDANIWLVRNATFFEPNIHLNFQLKSHGVIF